MVPSDMEVVWLAGYPRSGAALVRTILAHCFGQYTSSQYIEDVNPEYERLLKHIQLSQKTDDSVRRLLNDQDVITVKTHERPGDIDCCRAIIIVRDGRPTLDSLKAFYAALYGGLQVGWPEMVLGKHKWGSWSRWIQDWAHYRVKNTLWLRYEDIREDLASAVNRLGAWLGLKPTSHKIPPFKTFHRAHPGIFRKAQRSSAGILPEEHEELFWRMHGSTMSMLGYYREEAA